MVDIDRQFLSAGGTVYRVWRDGSGYQRWDHRLQLRAPIAVRVGVDRRRWASTAYVRLYARMRSVWYARARSWRQLALLYGI